MRRNNLAFHPLSVSIVSVFCVVAYAVWMRWRFPGGDLTQHYIYVLPIIVPFVSFLFDRGRVFRQITWLQGTIEVLVVAISILRMLGYLPIVSGHALFLSYAIAAPVSKLTRLTAALVMIQVIYLKVFVWHDFITPVAGTLLGLTAALVVSQLGAASSPGRSPMTLTAGNE